MEKMKMYKKMSVIIVVLALCATACMLFALADQIHVKKNADGSISVQDMDGSHGPGDPGEKVGTGVYTDTNGDVKGSLKAVGSPSY